MKHGTVLRVNVSWAVIVAAGIGAFVLAKKSIDKQRYDAMKSRERMKRATEGEYSTTRNFVQDDSVKEIAQEIQKHFIRST